MSIQIQIRGGTTAEHSAFKGVSREITCDTDKNTIVVQDGQTPGGFPLARENLSNVSAEDIKARGAVLAADLVGEIIAVPLASFIGFLKCDGAAISRETYAALFAKIGTKYGAGDGETTFCLPDFRDCFLRGADGTLAKAIGTKQNDAAPNITSNTKNIVVAVGGNNAAPGNFTGALTGTGRQVGAAGMQSGQGSWTNLIDNFGINASLSSDSYGRDNTTEVRPKNHAINFFIRF